MGDNSVTLIDRLFDYLSWPERRVSTTAESTDSDDATTDSDSAQRSVSSEQTDVTHGTDARAASAVDDDSNLLEDLDPSELQTLTDVQLVLGMTPEQFITRLLAENDGELKQQELTECTEWSSSTISRLLQKLEHNGDIVRIQVGRQKAVYLPEEVPARRSSTRDDVRVA